MQPSRSRRGRTLKSETSPAGGERATVNTFLPFSDFGKTARALDQKRLGKQRVEAYQVLLASLGMTKGWASHPVTRMWRGYEYLLADYGIAICREWTRRGHRDTLLPKFLEMRARLPRTGRPFWLGRREFHRSHRSNLNRKDPSHYRFKVPSDLPYLWPDNSTRTFRVAEGRGAQGTEENDSTAGVR